MLPPVRRRTLSLSLLLLATLTITTAFLLPSPSPSPAALTHTHTRTHTLSTCFSSLDSSSPAAQEQTQTQTRPSPSGGSRRNNYFPKPTGPWVLLEGLPYAAVEADVRVFLQGFEVKSVQMPLAPENTKRAGETKGIAVVELPSEEEAVKAVGALNGKEILGRWVTVEQCMSPHETKTIKIRGVPFAATPDDLSSYFSSLFGEVEYVIISHDRNGIAYITFKEPQSAVAALAQDGCQMNNRWLDITLYLKGTFRAQGQGEERPRRDGEQGKASSSRGGGGGGDGGSGSGSSMGNNRKNRVRLSGIPFEATLEEVTEALQALDLPISNVFLPPFKANPERNIGIAYLNIPSDVDYQRALALASLQLRDRVVYIKEATDRLTISSSTGEERESFSFTHTQTPSSSSPRVRDKPWQNRVYLGNLPFDITSEDIGAFFERNGVTGLSKIALPKTKIGTAYLAFESAEMAERAVGLDGQLIDKDGRTRYLRANLMDT